jgi:hypothetical protein
VGLLRLQSHIGPVGLQITGTTVINATDGSYPQGFPFLIHAGGGKRPSVTGFACLPETTPLLPDSTASPETCIAACGAKYNVFYFANLYGYGNDTCGRFCTCPGTCRETRPVAGEILPTCLSSDLFDVKTTTKMKHTAKVSPGGLVRR